MVTNKGCDFEFKFAFWVFLCWLIYSWISFHLITKYFLNWCPPNLFYLLKTPLMDKVNSPVLKHNNNNTIPGRIHPCKNYATYYLFLLFFLVFFSFYIGCVEITFFYYFFSLLIYLLPQLNFLRHFPLITIFLIFFIAFSKLSNLKDSSSFKIFLNSFFSHL